MWKTDISYYFYKEKGENITWGKEYIIQQKERPSYI